MREWVGPAGLWRRAVGMSIAMACCIGGFANAAPAEAPVVPGFERLKEAKADQAVQGELLLGELNCLQCHSAQGQQRIFTKGAPDLSNAGARLTPQYLRAYLADPHGVKPGATMPDIFHSSDPAARQGAVDYLTHYLVSLGGPMNPAGEEGNVMLVEMGRKAYHQVGCVACHAPEKKGAMAVASVPLPNLAEKTTVDQLVAFLLDPAKVRPGGRMPNLHLSRDEARAIAVYLLRDQLDNPQNASAGPARVRGAKYSYYERVPETAAVDQLDRRKPKSEGHIDQFTLNIPGHANDNFAVKYTAAIHIPRDGKYTFYTTSDDGSRLYLGKNLIVDNDGTHPATEKSGTVDLREGDQPITVTYFQGGGEFVLKVEWEGPGLARQEIPADALYTVGGRPMVPLHQEQFVVDPQKAEMGGRMFAAMGCVSCHAVPGAGKAMRQQKTLADLNVESPTGCLGNKIAKGAPNYGLNDEQRQAIKAALKNVKELDKPFDAKETVAHLTAAFNCLACHVRGDTGGPAADRAEYFVMSAPFDMGDEGRIPPRLTNVGTKLTPAALEQIIFEGKLHIRPVLATHMPIFSKEKAGAIVDALVKADGATPDKPVAFNEIYVKDGRQLVGTKGLGCVNCHGVNGVKSLGMPAPDLGTAQPRLKPAWFHELLANPAHVNPGTRMPAFWADGAVAFPKLAGGTMDTQIDAIWSYLSLGQSMALPSGLLPAAGEELIPTDSAIVHRTFMADVSNRAVLVGFPEMVHVAFDADVVRLAKAWKGRFFDAKGMWEGRGGSHLGPLGTDVINLPQGPALAMLEKPDAAWPTPKPKERNLGGRFKGYELDKEDRPIFHYVLNDIDIHEQPLPLLKPGGAELLRTFKITAKAPVTGLYFLAAEGRSLEPKSPGEWIADGKLTVRLANGSSGIGQPIVRESGGSKQLLIPVTFNNGSADFTVEMSW
jgi:mono/diheme cytochrome c family protein